MVAIKSDNKGTIDFEDVIARKEHEYDSNRWDRVCVSLWRCTARYVFSLGSSRTSFKSGIIRI